jgi:hypothetical protein
MVDDEPAFVDARSPTSPLAIKSRIMKGDGSSSPPREFLPKGSPPLTPVSVAATLVITAWPGLAHCLAQPPKPSHGPDPTPRHFRELQKINDKTVEMQLDAYNQALCFVSVALAARTVEGDKAHSVEDTRRALMNRLPEDMREQLNSADTFHCRRNSRTDIRISARRIRPLEIPIIAGSAQPHVLSHFARAIQENAGAPPGSDFCITQYPEVFTIRFAEPRNVNIPIQTDTNELRAHLDTARHSPRLAEKSCRNYRYAVCSIVLASSSVDPTPETTIVRNPSPWEGSVYIARGPQGGDPTNLSIGDAQEIIVRGYTLEVTYALDASTQAL